MGGLWYRPGCLFCERGRAISASSPGSAEIDGTEYGWAVVKFGPMKRSRKQRLWVVAAIVTLSGIAVGLSLLALRENVNFFYSPAQIVAGEAPVNRLLRGGGMVKENSVVRSEDSLMVTFVISDLKGADVTVRYEGILPDLFREGQGVVAVGRLDEDRILNAREVLAKHDENYMPPEVAEVIDEAHLRPDEQNTFTPL